jgi:hypothetical protein
MPEQTLDLWAPDLVREGIRTPLSILRQQASLLGSKTNNLVEAEVQTATNSPSEFVHNFVIVASVLSYRYSLCQARHGIELYPVGGTFDGHQTTLVSEQTLLEWLKQVLTSEKTKSVVSALIAQSRT